MPNGRVYQVVKHRNSNPAKPHLRNAAALRVERCALVQANSTHWQVRAFRLDSADRHAGIGEWARMSQWLVAALVLYGLAITVATAPQIQTALWKLGHITLGGWAGYWISRTIERQRVHQVEDMKERNELRRSQAIIVAAAMIAMAFGL